MTKIETELAKFVADFLEEYGSAELKTLWKSDGKPGFTKLAKKLIPAEEKMVKDKDAPKGPRNSYIYYCMDERARVQAEHPGLGPREVSKVLGEEWTKAKMVPATLKYYQDLADADKTRAKTEKSSYVPKPSTPKKKATRAKSGWDLYCAANRADVKTDGFTGHDIMKELGRRWKNLDEDEAAEYNEKALEMKNGGRVKEEVKEDEDEE